MPALAAKYGPRKGGHPPRVLTSSALVGSAKATALFEAAYDEHGRRLAKLYEHLGATDCALAAPSNSSSL